MYTYYILLLMSAMGAFGTLIIKPTDVVGVAGVAGVDVVTFNCSTNAYLAVMWSFRNMTGVKIDITFEGVIKSGLRYRYESNVTDSNGHKELDLIVAKLDFNHTGTYTCTDLEGVSDDYHSVQLTVIAPLPLRAEYSGDGTFVLISELTYSGNLHPRISCFDLTNDTFINVSKSTVKNSIKWTSENLTAPLCATTFKCVLEFCSSEVRCHPRTFKQTLLTGGKNAICRDSTTTTEKLPDEIFAMNNERVLYYVVLPLLGLLALAVGVVIVICAKSKRSAVAKRNEILSKERLRMI